jgi:hypothetical protein
MDGPSLLDAANADQALVPGTQREWPDWKRHWDEFPRQEGRPQFQSFFKCRRRVERTSLATWIHDSGGRGFVFETTKETSHGRPFACRPDEDAVIIVGNISCQIVPLCQPANRWANA